ncbi:MAG: helix-turn-helix transcriptional regulator [Pseudomonadales bacterium]|jgi:DNA-binding Xre family transcriptional regulator
MAQIHALVKTLKKQLKANDKTYADVAGCLELSEASVKRLFAEENFTLQRLACICDMLGMELSDLVAAMNQEQERLSQLSEAQEKEIAGDLLLLLIAVCVIHGFSYDEILRRYEISEAECIQKLAKLDRLKIIELLPGNRIKLRVAANFNWLPNGPIQRFFHHRVQQDFFNCRFDKAHEKLIVLNGLLSDGSNAEFQRKMQRLAREFDHLCVDDSALPMEQRNGTSVVLAIRQWQYSIFEGLRKG